jgi:hypothetical protein
MQEAPLEVPLEQVEAAADVQPLNPHEAERKETAEEAAKRVASQWITDDSQSSEHVQVCAGPRIPKPSPHWKGGCLCRLGLLAGA